MSDGRRPFEVPPESVRATADAPAARPLAPVELVVTQTRAAAVPVLVPPPARPRRTLLKVFGASAVLFSAGAIGLQLWDFTIGVLGRNATVGVPLAMLLGITAFTGVVLLVREVFSFTSEMRKLRDVEELAREAAVVLAGNGHGRALALAARIIDPLRHRPELADAIEHFRASATTAHSDRQVLDLLADGHRAAVGPAGVSGRLPCFPRCRPWPP